MLCYIFCWIIFESTLKTTIREHLNGKYSRSAAARVVIAHLFNCLLPMHLLLLRANSRENNQTFSS